MATKKKWVLTASKKTITEAEKIRLSNLFEPLINEFRKKYIETKPDTELNYIVNFHSKFYRGFFYLFAEYKSEYDNRISDGFERKFARLEFIDTNKYNLAYFRHTGQWWTVQENVTAEHCLGYITDNVKLFI